MTVVCKNHPKENLSVSMVNFTEILEVEPCVACINDAIEQERENDTSYDEGFRDGSKEGYDEGFSDGQEDARGD